MKGWRSEVKLSGDGAPFYRSTFFILSLFSLPFLDPNSVSATGKIIIILCHYIPYINAKVVARLVQPCYNIANNIVTRLTPPCNKIAIRWWQAIQDFGFETVSS